MTSPYAPLSSAEARSLFTELAHAWRNTPAPPDATLAKWDVAEGAEVDAVSIAHGWMARVVRSSEAALVAGDAGYAYECAPLIRSVIEHSSAMWWIAAHRGNAVQALIRHRAERARKLEDAQTHGWQVDESTAAQLREAVEAGDLTDAATRQGDYLLHMKHRAEEFDLGSLYQAWLIETAESHPTFESAAGYFRYRHDELRGVLLTEPEGSSPLEMQVCLALLVALHAYNDIHGSNPYADSLADWDDRLQMLVETLAAEKSASGDI